MKFNFKSKKFVIGSLLAAVCALGTTAATAGYSTNYNVSVHWQFYDVNGQVVGGGSSDCNGNLSSYGTSTSVVTTTMRPCR